MAYILKTKFAKLIDNPNAQAAFLLIITGIGALLRFYKLGEWSFWGDEMFTVGGREDGFNFNIFRQSLSMTLIQTTVNFLGVTEWNARLVPVLFGVTTIPVLYFFIRKVFNPGVGLTASLFLALSHWHIYWSQNARFYTALLLFYTLAVLTFYLGIEEDRPWYLVASLVFLGLAARERLLALFFIPVVLGYLLILKIAPFRPPAGLRWRNLAIFILPGLGLGLFFVFPYALNTSDWLAGYGYPNNSPFWILIGVVYYVGLPTISAGTFGGLYLLLQKNRAALLLSLSAVIPLLIIMGIAPFHYTANRYVFISLSSWIILSSAAVHQLSHQVQAKTKVLVAGFALILLVYPLSEDILYFRYQNGNRENWKSALEFVRTRKSAGDLVLTSNTELGDFYLGAETSDYWSLDLAEMDEIGIPVWFVEDQIALDLAPERHEWLAENARLVGIYDTHIQARAFIMRVYLYDPE